MPDRTGSGRLPRALTLLITYAIKLVGLGSAFNQLLLQSNPRPFPLAIAAFMMAGAQFSEGLVLSVIDRFVVTGPEQRKALTEQPPDTQTEDRT